MLLKYLIVLSAIMISFSTNAFCGSEDSSYFYFPLKKKNVLKQFVKNKISDEPNENNKGEYKRWYNLKFSGYARPFFQYRTLPVRYSETSTSQKAITINGFDVTNGEGTGYQEPILLLRLEGNPTSKTSFKVEYAFDHQLTGVNKDSIGPISNGSTLYNRRVAGYRILQFEAAARTTFGTFNFISGGGVNWYKLTPFTLWNYEYRDDMFERYPWEPEGYSFARYHSYYATQNVNRDIRWGNTATQGFIIQGKSLPMGFGFSILYGKTDNSGGFQSYLSKTPKSMAALKVEKMLGNHKIGFTYFNQFGYLDQIGLYKVNQNIFTGEGRLQFKNFSLYTEIGLGRYQDSILTNKNHELIYGSSLQQKDTILGLNYLFKPCINFHLDFKKEITLIPLNLQFYYIDKSVVNVNSYVLNSSNPHALANYNNIGTASDVTTFEGAITDIGQMTNNRWAVNLKHEDSYGKLKVMTAISAGQELDNLFNIISFQHRANQFTRSRFGYFTSRFGPYGRLVQTYRRTFEKVYITDNDSLAGSYKKAYNSIDISFKYSFKVFKKELILSNYNNYNSVADKFSSVPEFSDKAFLRFIYTEFMAFYALHPKVTLVGFFSLEKVQGNERTEMVDAEGTIIVDPLTQKPIFSEGGKPRDQSGHGYGIGLDYDYASRAGLYIRHRWFSHQDKNFVKDVFKGQETSVELKIFF